MSKELGTFVKLSLVRRETTGEEDAAAFLAMS